MIRLFPKAQKILFFGLAASLFVTGMMIVMGEGAFAIFTAITGCWASWFCALYSAISAHGKQLNVLYDELKPEEFRQNYAPLLERAKAGSAMEAAMRAHIGNALASEGRYEEALSWYTSDSQRSDVRLMQLENRCRCLLALGETEKLRKETEAWQSLIEKVKKSRAEVSRRTLALLQIREKVETGKADTNDQIAIQQEQRGTNKRLHRAEMSLLLAKIYRILGFLEAERQELEGLSKLNPELICCREAKELLSAFN